MTEGRTPSIEELLTLQRDAIAGLIRSPALAGGDVEYALIQITEAAARLLSVQRASVWKFDERRTRIDCLDLYESKLDRHERGASLTYEMAPAYFDAAIQERCIAAHDALRDSRTREFADGYLVPLGIGAMLDAPVIVRGQLIGVVCHEHVGAARTWSAREELLAGTLADFVGMTLSASEHANQARELALLRDNLERRVDQRTRELAKSREALRTMLSAAPVPLVVIGMDDAKVRFGNERAAEMFGTALADLVGTDAAALWVEPEERQRFVALLQNGQAVDGFAARLSTIGGKSFWGLISGRTTVLDDENVVIGGIADLTTQKEVEQRLRELATHDALTGVFNRRHFFEVADATLTVADRHGKGACLAMLDIDHFKRVNDEHGHLVGDEVLRRVTRASREAIRGSDVLARYGGEELVLLLPEADIEAAHRIVERIRAAVADERLETDSGPVSVTLSGGVAAREPGEILEKLIRRADTALYAAKHAGRNRVATA